METRSSGSPPGSGAPQGPSWETPVSSAPHEPRGSDSRLRGAAGRSDPRPGPVLVPSWHYGLSFRTSESLGAEAAAEAPGGAVALGRPHALLTPAMSPASAQDWFWGEGGAPGTVDAPSPGGSEAGGGLHRLAGRPWSQALLPQDPPAPGARGTRLDPAEGQLPAQSGEGALGSLALGRRGSAAIVHTPQVLCLLASRAPRIPEPRMGYAAPRSAGGRPSCSPALLPCQGPPAASLPRVGRHARQEGAPHGAVGGPDPFTSCPGVPSPGFSGVLSALGAGIPGSARPCLGQMHSRGPSATPFLGQWREGTGQSGCRAPALVPDLDCAPQDPQEGGSPAKPS